MSLSLLYAEEFMCPSSPVVRYTLYLL